MKRLRTKSWSPYAVGVGLGALSWFAFATADRGLGITTAFEYAAGLVFAGLVPSSAAAYLQEHSPKIDWEWMVVLGVFIGSFLSSLLSNDRRHPAVPPLWRERFGSSAGLRMAAAFLGGAVMMLGARLARGCTSGHGISGTLQLAVSSWIFITLAFFVAIASAFLIYGRPNTQRGE